MTSRAPSVFEFSEDVESLSYSTLKDNAFDLQDFFKSLPQR